MMFNNYTDGKQYTRDYDLSIKLSKIKENSYYEDRALQLSTLLR